MKEMLVKLFADKRADLTKALEQKAGFNAADAGKFLPVILDKMKGLIGDGKFDLSKLADFSALKSKIDPKALAAQSGVDAGKAGKGLDVVFDKVKDLLGAETGGVAGMLGQAGKIFGR
ncbi:MAG: hypothetical protein ACKVXR_04665 [Planctomycetota bacterium]